MDEYLEKSKIISLLEHNDKVQHYADRDKENIVYSTVQSLCKAIAEANAADVQSKLDKAEKELAETKEENKVLMQECDRLIKEKGELLKNTRDAVPIVYIGRKAYMAENTIKTFMKKMDIIRDSLVRIESYFNTYAETIRQIHACAGEYVDNPGVKYFIDRIKDNARYD